MTLREVARGFGRAFSADTDAALGRELAAHFSPAHAWPVSSGRAAMTLILRAMRAAHPERERDEVIVPAYTCYSVPAAVALAGLKPRLCDVDPDTFGLDPGALEKIDTSRAVAIVSANLYGIPNALPQIEAIAKRRGVYFLDDAAQSLGARIGGRPAGTFGDAGLVSFDKGKIICTIQGGAILARPGAVATEIARAMTALQASPLTETWGNAAKLVVYAMCLRPAMYGFIRRLPFLGLGRTEYETRYLIARLGNLQAGVATLQLQRLGALNAARRRTAAALGAALGALPGIHLPVVLPGSEPVYARFPVRVATDLRDAALRALDAAGIGASASYPHALCDVPEVLAQLREPGAPMPGARQLATEILTLPTHGYVPETIGARIRQLLTADTPGFANA